MSEQTVSKSAHEISQEIIEEIEGFFSMQIPIEEGKKIVFSKVDTVKFLTSYFDMYGTCEEFKVNNVVIIKVVNGETWEYSSVERYKERRKAFGKRVTSLMKETNVTWNLAKLAVNRCNPKITSETALDFINAVKEALGWYQMEYENKIPIEEYLERNPFISNLTTREIAIIKAYWCRALKV